MNDTIYDFMWLLFAVVFICIFGFLVGAGEQAEEQPIAFNQSCQSFYPSQYVESIEFKLRDDTIATNITLCAEEEK